MCADCLSPLHLHALYDSSLRLSNTLFPVAISIFKIVDIPGVIILFCYILPNLSSVANSSVFADLHIFPSTSLITGDALRPDLIMMLNNTSVYVMELTVGFKSNIEIDSDCMATEYHPLIATLQRLYSSVHLVNISMSAL